MAWVLPDDQNWFQKPPRAGQTSVAPVSQGSSPAPPPGSVVVAPGYTPNYKDLILNDPSYLAWKNSASLDLHQAAASRKAALDALVVQYGGIGGLKDAYGDIDQTTLDLAGKNEYSDLHRLQRNYEQGVQQFKQSLAARGGLSSGELGYGLDQADYARGSAEYDLGQQFSSAAQQAINNYLGTESAARQAEAAAIAQAEANQYGNPANRPGDAVTGALDPDWRQKYGVPVYHAPDGSMYTIDANGNPTPYSGGQMSYTDPLPTSQGSYGGGRGGFDWNNPFQNVTPPASTVTYGGGQMDSWLGGFGGAWL